MNHSESTPLSSNNPHSSSLTSSYTTLVAQPELANTTHHTADSDVSLASEVPNHDVKSTLRTQTQLSNDSSSSSSSSVSGWISCTSQIEEDLSEGSTTTSQRSGISFTSRQTKNHKRIDHDMDNSLHRHLTLIDLICIGVAATVGSGIFVLCGLIAHDFAGPSTFICWLIAALSCCTSGLCFAELSGKFSVSGSTYLRCKF